MMLLRKNDSPKKRSIIILLRNSLYVQYNDAPKEQSVKMLPRKCPKLCSYVTVHGDISKEQVMIMLIRNSPLMMLLRNSP